MRHRFVRTIVATGIVSMSALAVLAGSPEDAAGSAAPQGINESSTALPDVRLWGAMLGLGVATAGVALMVQRRQHAFDVEQRRLQQQDRRG